MGYSFCSICCNSNSRAVLIMQTFITSLNLSKAAAELDRQRLGKQRSETLQILQALHGETNGWRNHPAVRMWRGYEQYLIIYGVAICDEWIRRGYKDTCRDKILRYAPTSVPFITPPWLTEEFCSNHRSILLGKAFEDTIIKKGYSIQKAYEVLNWYHQFDWDEYPASRNEKGQWPYIWPV